MQFNLMRNLFYLLFSHHQTLFEFRYLLTSIEKKFEKEENNADNAYPSSSFIVVNVHFAACFYCCTTLETVSRCRCSAALRFLNISIISLIFKIEYFRIQDFVIDFGLIKRKNIFYSDGFFLLQI